MSGDIHTPAASPRTTEAWQTTLRRLEEIRQLEQRIAGLKRRLVVGDGAMATPREVQTTSLLLVRLGERLFALPISTVEEVLRMVALTPPDAGVKGVIGLADYHGRPVAVIDPRGLLGETPAPIRASQAVVLCKLEPLLLGLRVDEVVDITQVQPDDIYTAEEVLPGGLRCTGVVRTKEGTALLLEPVLLAVAAELVNLLDQAPAGAGA